jgi:hypothetical protein
MIYLYHLPVCYIAKCKILGFVHIYTCPECSGKQTHSQISNTKKRKRLKNTPTPPPTVEIDDTSSDTFSYHDIPTPTTTTTTITTTIPTTPKTIHFTISTNKMLGKYCIIYNAYKSKSVAIPYIHIGKFRKFILCKKSHLIDYHTVLNNTSLRNWKSFKMEIHH